MKPLDPIAYDYSDLIVPKDASSCVRLTGLVEADLKWLAPRLAAARQEVFENLAMYERRASVPEEMQPLDAAFFDLPERLMDEDRPLLDRIVAAGDRLAKEVDRVLVLGIGGSYMGARALFEACCHPYHNEISRQRRGGRPRIYFEGNNLDNDAVQGLLDLVEGADDWGIIVISKSGGTLETAVAFRVFFEALKTSCGGDREKLRRRVLAVTGDTGRLHELAEAIGCQDVFPIPDGVGGRFSVLSAVGLLPAAVMGLDVQHLLEGAAAMNERFRTKPPLENPVLDYVGMSRLMETRRGDTIRVLSTWGKGLESVGFWYDQLLSESLGKNGLGATPLTVVNTRDLHSRGQQHQEGRRDKLITNLVVEHTAREPVTIERSDLDQDKLNALSGKTYQDLLRAAFTGTNQAYAEDYRRTATIRLPRLDEGSLGQLFQMLMVATVVEGRLVGINPYGQPGVEGYKKNMNAILRGK
ncbi:MAG: glucose-6-phosphate isomerase [Planctomycetaceae bacterium]|nr:glucose-6-phosphate isomerase [Planctomycetaceae bacterium]